MILVIDTATRTPVVAVAAPDGSLVAERRWTSNHRHGEELLQRIDEVLAEAAVPKDSLTGVVVGTGPGSFTGLRIGLASAKTIAYSLGIPVAGVGTIAALAAADGDPGAIVTLPAGAADRYVYRAGSEPSEPALVAGMEVDPGAVAIDLDAAPETARARGERALAWLAGALAAIGARRLAQGTADDVEQLVPAYVALPRGIARAAADMQWSPDLR